MSFTVVLLLNLDANYENIYLNLYLSVIWLRNGKEIKDESYVKFGFADGSYTMEISNPEYKRDSGTYTAKLVGKDSAVETTCDVQINRYVLYVWRPVIIFL